VAAGESVSGKVSEELAQDGALAILFAMLGIALYIWFASNGSSGSARW
jgi:preprotein translocase subunit SecF